ncbi:PGN_0703 family putative restriction endonuclease [Erythrobacter aurantius]|uniref:PGN_0703 family putative restriction endonuclease n=1 Tax=Erythrobacter aurantius TaxID=2909249 RepID=UPI00207A400C|nr:hypothetical protein [Erythrobacter aurantius]
MTAQDKMASLFLPGVPVNHILQRLTDAGGKEIESGKLASPESSAALAVNCFGWFIPRLHLLPSFPDLEEVGRVQLVDVEFCARFPWSGGRHPWLDAVIQTSSMLIGVESKRYEPFRDAKKVDLSPAYDRDVWGPNMRRFEDLRDQLRSGETKFEYLDGAQLLKHAFGLVTEGRRRDRVPVLAYIYAEPRTRSGKPIDAEMIREHRAEADRFGNSVAGDDVRFIHSSYRDWLAHWNEGNPELTAHRDRVVERFDP